MNAHATTTQRLMIPVNADNESRRGVQTALQRQRAGEAVEVVLLHVAEPVTAWQVLRSMTRAEVAAFQAQSAAAFLVDAARPLVAAQIPCRTLFLSGSVVQTILDSAAANDCDEILLPAPATGWRKLFSRGVTAALHARARRVAVTMLGATAAPA